MYLVADPGSYIVAFRSDKPTLNNSGKYLNEDELLDIVVEDNPELNEGFMEVDGNIYYVGDNIETLLYGMNLTADQVEEFLQSESYICLNIKLESLEVKKAEGGKNTEEAKMAKDSIDITKLYGLNSII